ncbi:MAG: diaminopimelate decarboxylase [Rhodospirillales bacterium]|nr:diaminopimelate decarboxylase [Rhodospirillales bacterium]
MTGFTDKNGVLYADDISLTEIAAVYGTPSYVYSASKIRANVRALQQAFLDTLPEHAQPLIAFACKANSNIAVLKLLQTLGLGIDIVSGGELKRAQAAGISAPKTVFSGVGKSDAEIISALKSGILQINVESAPEMEHIAVLAEKIGIKAPIALRLNPDEDAGTHAKITTGTKENKFGMLREEVEVLYRRAADHPWLEPQGLSLHIGSQLTTLEPFAAAFKKLADLAQWIKEQGLPLTTLDLGGGLGVVYNQEKAPCLKSYATLVRDIIHPLDTQIILEPGRMITGEAGLLLTRALYVKEGQHKSFVIVDSGMNDLARPAMYDAFHPIRMVENRDEPMKTYDIVGPICETGDTFAKGRHLPPAMPGDLLAIMVSGAYGYVMASNYNTRSLPAEILVDGDKHALIHERQSVEDILAQETIPDWL